jgi:hypothetical protein
MISVGFGLFDASFFIAQCLKVETLDSPKPACLPWDSHIPSTSQCTSINRCVYVLTVLRLSPMQWPTNQFMHFPQMNANPYATNAQATNQVSMYTNGPSQVQTLPPSSPPAHNESLSHLKASVPSQFQRSSTPASENTAVDEKSSSLPNSESTAYVLVPLCL